MKKDLRVSFEEKIYQIKAYLDGTLTSEEEAKFRQWLDISIANQVLLDRIRDKRILFNKMRFIENSDKKEGWNDIQRRIRKRPVVFIRFIRYVAMWIGVVGIGVAVYQVIDSQEEKKLLIRKEAKSVKEKYKAYLELATGERWVLDNLNEVMTWDRGTMVKTENKEIIIINEQKIDFSDKKTVKILFLTVFLYRLCRYFNHLSNQAAKVRCHRIPFWHPKTQ